MYFHNEAKTMKIFGVLVVDKKKLREKFLFFEIEATP
jgi:hypothetical protein